MFISVPAALADWDTDDLYKWVQLPDLGVTGIDVSATAELVLADDFLCTESGDIAEITVWGAWEDDVLPFGNAPDSVTWNGRNAAGKKAPSGVYLYRMKSGGRQASNKMLLLR